MARQSIYVSIARIIKILRAEGSLSPGDLKKKVGMPRRTFYRALSALRDGGVVVKEGERYYWYEFVDTRRYGSEFEANQALKHSRNIASGLKHIMGRSGTYFVEGDLMPNAEYAEPALMHLRTGYSGTYEVFEKAENIRGQVNKKEREFEDGIKARLLASSLQPQYPEHVAKIVHNDIKEVLRGRKPYFLTNLHVEGEKVCSGAYTFLAESEMFEQLKHLIMKEEASKENKEICRRIVELENKYYNLRQIFEREIESLIMQVENGTPLKGSCQLCPRVKIIKPKTITKKS